MADAARFPQLAVPFAVVGGAAGWLSTAFLSDPLIRQFPRELCGLSAGLAAGVGALTGALMTRWCVGKRYAYQLESVDPDARLPSDTWRRHVAAVLVAGATIGATLAALHGDPDLMPLCALGGTLCAAAFLPVCVAVISAARRAQRARLGSIVAGSDRRAVWGILAATLSVATLGGLVAWPAAAAGLPVHPAPALGMALAAAALTLAILAADARARRQVRRALSPGLTPQTAADLSAADAAAPRLDLGLGDELLARLSRGASAYRARERTLALVQGDPDQAGDALGRAVRRGSFSVAGIGAIVLAHLAATTTPALVLYHAHQCDQRTLVACRAAAELVQAEDPAQAMRLYHRGCGMGVAADCAAVAALHERQGRASSLALALTFYHRACESADAPSCRRAADLLDRRGEESIGGRTAEALRARACGLGDGAGCERDQDAMK
jgi:hypothetical protein